MLMTHIPRPRIRFYLAIPPNSISSGSRTHKGRQHWGRKESPFNSDDSIITISLWSKSIDDCKYWPCEGPTIRVWPKMSKCLLCDNPLFLQQGSIPPPTVRGEEGFRSAQRPTIAHQLATLTKPNQTTKSLKQPRKIMVFLIEELMWIPCVYLIT